MPPDMSGPTQWGGLGPESAPVPTTDVAPGGNQYFPNREELSFMVRVIGGWFPILVLMVLFYGVLVYAWLSDPGSPLIAGLLVAWTVVAIAAAVWLAKILHARTPTKIEITGSGVIAVWSGNPSRREIVPFNRITTSGPSHWRWVSAAKASHYAFTPASIQYERRSEDGSDLWGVHGLNQEVIYLTNPNFERVQAAFRRWGGSERIREESPLPESADLPDASEDPNLLPPGWVKCARCGAPLKRHLEIESGLCVSCLKSGSGGNPARR
jgi:hypothetical protein